MRKSTPTENYTLRWESPTHRPTDIIASLFYSLAEKDDTSIFPSWDSSGIFVFLLLEKIDLVKQFGRAEDTRQDVPVEDRMFSQRLLLNSGQAYFLLNVNTVLKRKYIKVWMQRKKILFMFLQHRPLSLSTLFYLVSLTIQWPELCVCVCVIGCKITWMMSLCWQIWVIFTVLVVWEVWNHILTG